MKIAIVIDIYQDKGNGTSISARHYVEQLRARGHEVIVLCTAVEGKDDGDKDIISFPIKKIPFFQKTCESQHAILAAPDDARIREAFKGVDVVHVYMPFWLGTHSAKIAHEMDIPVLGCYHISAENLTFNAGLKHVPFSTSIAYKFMRNVHYKTDWILDIYCPSRCIASTIFKYHYAQSLHIISNGYDPNFKQIEVVRPSEFDGKTVIVSVGRLTEEKRQDLIIKAVGRLKNKKDVVLILAGKGPKQKKYEELARKRGVDLRIGFYTQQELIELLNYADLFVQASDVETESISCLEAIACGTVPVISNARMCATKQFALDKRSLFRKGRARNLAKRIRYYMAHKDEAQELRTSYADFAKRFSLKTSIDSIEEVYKLMLNRKNSNEFVIRDYNNPLSVTVQLDEKHRPEKRYRPLLHQLYKLMKK